MQFGFAFFISLLLLRVLTPMATHVDLVDRPSQRKNHRGAVPLIGGLSIYLTLVVIALLFPSPGDTIYWFLGVAGLLVLVGALDDHGDLNVSVRIVIEVIAANMMILGAGVYVTDLGNLLGLGHMHMPFWAAYPFTLVAVFGILNAFNMIDGLDGLASGLCLVALAVLYTLTDSSATLQLSGPVIAGALVAFLLCNLQLLPGLPKVFLGDAGSKLLGFALVWWLISGTQATPADPSLQPVTALYMVGLPLIDMVATTVRRLRKKISPFYPDHTHIHHILLRAGFSRRTSLMIILSAALVINLMGILMARLGVPAFIQFGLFFALYWLYAYNIRHAFKVTKKLNRLAGRKSILRPPGNLRVESADRDYAEGVSEPIDR